MSFFIRCCPINANPVPEEWQVLMRKGRGRIFIKIRILQNRSIQGESNVEKLFGKGDLPNMMICVPAGVEVEALIPREQSRIELDGES